MNVSMEFSSEPLSWLFFNSPLSKRVRHDTPLFASTSVWISGKNQKKEQRVNMHDETEWRGMKMLQQSAAILAWILYEWTTSGHASPQEVLSGELETPNGKLEYLINNKKTMFQVNFVRSKHIFKYQDLNFIHFDYTTTGTDFM